MELIQIIYTVLLYGGGSLFVVIIFSFMISKARMNGLPHAELPEAVLNHKLVGGKQYNYHKNDFVENLPRQLVQSEQTRLRKLSSQSQPQIFQIDRTNQREIKIVRKPTFHSNSETQEDQFNRTQRNNSRYTIVNEKMNETKPRAMNFYL